MPLIIIFVLLLKSVSYLQAIELVDGWPVGESSVANVTIVVGDVNDQAPVFNEREFNVTIAEDIGVNIPLPGLNMVVTDMDVVCEWSKYEVQYAIWPRNSFGIVKYKNTNNC